MVRIAQESGSRGLSGQVCPSKVPESACSHVVCECKGGRIGDGAKKRGAVRRSSLGGGYCGLADAPGAAFRPERRGIWRLRPVRDAACPQMSKRPNSPPLLGSCLYCSLPINHHRPSYPPQTQQINPPLVPSARLLPSLPLHPSHHHPSLCRSPPFHASTHPQSPRIRHNPRTGT